MGFFNALKRLLPHAGHTGANEESRQRIRAAWGLEDEETGATKVEQDGSQSPSMSPAGTSSSAFDRSQWQKKLKRILDELPDSQPQWQELMSEAHALRFEPGWIAEQQREEFSFMVRRAAADKQISEADHHKLELAQADRHVRGRRRGQLERNPGGSGSLLRRTGQG